MPNHELNVGYWLKEWFDRYGPLLQRALVVYREHWELLLPATATVITGSVLTAGILAGPLGVGLYRLILRLIDRSSPLPLVRDVFSGFESPLSPLAFSIFWGMVFLTGIYLLLSIPIFGWLMSYLFFILFHAPIVFGLPFIADKQLSFREASQMSFTEFGRAPLSLLLFSFVAFVGGFFGIIALYIGVLTTAPIYFCAVAVVYRELLKEP